MDRTERFYRIDQLLKSSARSFVELQRSLGISKAQLKRDLAYMRERLNAPIEYDRDANGYRFGKPLAGPRYELPGLWFSAAEMHALLTMQHLLENLQPGLLAPHVKPLLDRLSKALDSGEHAEAEIAQRVPRRLEHLHVRPVPQDVHQQLAVVGVRDLEHVAPVTVEGALLLSVPGLPGHPARGH